MISVEFDPFDPKNPRWFADLEERASVINALSAKHGRSFWILKTTDGKEFRVVLYADAEAPVAFIATESFCGRIPLAKIKEISKNQAAEGQWERIEDSTEKRAFSDNWFKESKDRFVPPEVIQLKGRKVRK